MQEQVDALLQEIPLPVRGGCEQEAAIAGSEPISQ
jgi:hypothetical protein